MNTEFERGYWRPEFLFMCAIAFPMLVFGVIAAYASTRNPHDAARWEAIAGVLVVVGLGALGFCLPLYRQ